MLEDVMCNHLHTVSQCESGSGFKMDLVDGFDVTKPECQQLAVRAILSTRYHGLLWLAPPCSSWVWISADTAKRFKDSLCFSTFWDGKPTIGKGPIELFLNHGQNQKV